MFWELISSKVGYERIGIFRNDEWGYFCFEKIGVFLFGGLIYICLCFWVNVCLFVLIEDIINMFIILILFYLRLFE